MRGVKTKLAKDAITWAHDRRRPPMTVTLVACAKKKALEPAPAKDLYTSHLFRLARAFAERHGERWFVLSARHGLLAPTQVIAPYNMTLKSYLKRERAQWAQEKVLPTLTAAAPTGSRIIILAGRTYYEGIEPELLRLGYAVEVPMRGLDIFKMIQFLKKELANG